MRLAGGRGQALDRGPRGKLKGAEPVDFDGDGALRQGDDVSIINSKWSI